MSADQIGVSTTNVYFWLTPWRRVDEHLPLSHIAEVTHIRGFFWDAISVESSGGLRCACSACRNLKRAPSSSMCARGLMKWRRSCRRKRHGSNLRFAGEDEF